MNVPKLIVRLGAGAILLVLGVILFAGGNDYVVRLHIADALGLRNGSKVVEGGVQVGTVDLQLNARDQVIATLNIQRQYAPIGRDATAQIASVNLLGQKSLELNPGNRSRPAADGSMLPASGVTPTTDLDQVLDVLGPDTRARLTVLINEAGAALAGRRQDFSAFLGELPHSLTQGTALLAQLAQNNGTLADLVSHSDSFIGKLDTQRAALGQLIGTLGQSAQTVEARDAQLQSTLRQLPGTLSTARSFLDELRTTTVPLGPAARDIQTVAAPLQSVLVQLSPFTQAARPALAKAITAAPELTRLATGATPVLRAATPTLSALQSTSTDLVPVTHALSLSVDNIVAVATNWTHAIELRDQLSHVFRAEVTITPQTVKELVNRLLSSPSLSHAASAHRPARTPTPTAAGAPRAASGTAGPGAATATPAAPAGKGPLAGVGALLSGVAGGLLNGLNGALHPGAGTAPSGAPASGQGGAPASGLSGLLRYLLKP